MVEYHIINLLIFMSFYMSLLYIINIVIFALSYMLLYNIIYTYIYIHTIAIFLFDTLWLFQVVHQQNARSSSPERAQHPSQIWSHGSHGICASPRKQLELSRRRWSKFSLAPAKSPEHWEATPAVLLLLWCGLVARSCKLENLNWSTILYNLQFLGVSLSDVKII